MIVSASRRTDIPAFFSEWFINRVREGQVAVPNPLRPTQVRWVSLLPEDVEAIVFWTRNPGPLMPHLHELDERGFVYYFLCTVTGYPRALEPRTPAAEEAVRTMRALSERVGPQRVIWRYDPVLFAPSLDEEYHIRTVRRFATALAGATTRLVVSFIDFYRKTRRNLAQAERDGLGPFSARPTAWTLERFAQELVGAAGACGMEVRMCAEELALSALGIRPSSCVDAELIAELSGRAVPYQKDPNQRVSCGCTVSVDIGMYDSCLYGCRYCYATSSEARARANYRHLHDPRGSRLLGTAAEGQDSRLRSAKLIKKGLKLV